MNTRWLVAAAAVGCGFYWPIALASQVTVISIGDGDTITVNEGGRQVRIRLACIDAAETAQAPYGQQARTTLHTLLQTGAPVRLRKMAVDRYRQTIAEVYRGSLNINLALVRGGQAFVYRDYLQNCDRNSYLASEQHAAHNRQGIWQIPGGITRPWDWRRGQTSASRGSTPIAPGAAQASSGRLSCSRIGSWSRAQELLRQGHRYLDGDRDGEACEALR